jgi:hypothetical protein
MPNSTARFAIGSTSALVLALSIAACAAPPDEGANGAVRIQQTKQALKNCTSSSDVPGRFIDACLLAGGSEVRCSSGTSMCCRKCTADEDCDTACFDRVEDVREAPKDDHADPGDPPPGTIGFRR